MALPFTAHCQRGHDRVDFTDRAEFERHMTKAHKARKPAAKFDPGPRRGGLPNKYLRPSKAPKGTEGLTKVLSEYDHWGKSMDGLRGAFAGVADDWQTDEKIPAAELRTGDVFTRGTNDHTLYTVREVHGDTWTLSALVNGTERTARLTEKGAARLLAETVVIVKRAA